MKKIKANFIQLFYFFSVFFWYRHKCSLIFFFQSDYFLCRKWTGIGDTCYFRKCGRWRLTAFKSGQAGLSPTRKIFWLVGGWVNTINFSPFLFLLLVSSQPSVGHPSKGIGPVIVFVSSGKKAIRYLNQRKSVSLFYFYFFLN